MSRVVLTALLALVLSGCAMDPDTLRTLRALRGSGGGYDAGAENDRQAAWRERQNASFDRMMRGGL